MKSAALVSAAFSGGCDCGLNKGRSEDAARVNIAASSIRFAVYVPQRFEEIRRDWSRVVQDVR